MEILDSFPGTDNVTAVAAGEVDFCITSVSYYLHARAEVGDLAARFVGVVYARSPMAAIMRAGSPWGAAADLGRCRVGGSPEDRLVVEYQAALAARGVAPSTVVPLAYEAAPGALGRGKIDAVADFADLVPRVRRQAGTAVRAVRIGLDHYANGLLAGDHVPDETAAAMYGAVWAALARQRQYPEAGLGQLVDRYPSVEPADVLEGWALAEPSIFAVENPGSMTAPGWAATVAHCCATHGLPAQDPESVYRPALATPADPALPRSSRRPWPAPSPNP